MSDQPNTVPQPQPVPVPASVPTPTPAPQASAAQPAPAPMPQPAPAPASQQQYAQPHYQQQQYAQPQYQQSIPNEKNKIVTGLLAILLGTLGIHKFYLGYTTAGVITLCITLIGGLLTLGIASFVMAIIVLIEGIIYLTKSDADFYNTYVVGKRAWF